MKKRHFLQNAERQNAGSPWTQGGPTLGHLGPHWATIGAVLNAAPFYPYRHCCHDPEVQFMLPQTKISRRDVCDV